MTIKLFAGNTLIKADIIYKDKDDKVGRPNPPGAAGKYIQEVMGLRDRIQSTPFGRRWLDIVGTNKEPIYIVPCDDRNNACSQPLPDDAAVPTRERDSMAAGFNGGTGKGASIRVKFNTATVLRMRAAAAAVAAMTAGALTPAAVVTGMVLWPQDVSGAVLLVHEMTHAYRSAGGRFAKEPMAGLVDPVERMNKPDLANRFDNFEEWLAIVVENVFASGQGATTLRANWMANFPATVSQPAPTWGRGKAGPSDSEIFAEEYGPAITRMCGVEPRLFQAMLAAKGCWFNPVADKMLKLRKALKKKP